MAETAKDNKNQKTDFSINKQENVSAPSSVSDVIFSKDIIVHVDKPLPHLDKGTVRAFSATGKDKLAQNLVAYICDNKLTPRRVTSAKYAKVHPQGIIKLVKAGIIFWPKVEAERFCFIYENTIGRPLISQEERSPKLGWKHDEVILNVAKPFIQTLVNLRNMDVVHGTIWPGNIYYQGLEKTDKVVLGECLTAPASYHLPALYEPVERALADPIARGVGVLGDDLYSFGVTLAVIMRSHDPMQGKTDREIIEHKIEKGSYATLLGKDRLSGATLELLRGLLYDDPEQRWNLDDLEAWLDGRRLSPKQSPKRVKATRPLLLKDKKHIRPELLAIDMTDHTDEMIRIIESGDLNLWIERAIEDKTIKLRIEQTLKEVEKYDRTEGYSARASAAMAASLYPEVPIHFFNIRFHALGFGKALTNAYQEQKNLQDYIDVMRGMFAITCIRLQKAGNMASQVSKFDACRGYLNKTELNSGLERCLYYMNPETHCLSPILEKYHVLTPEGVLRALEGVCEENKPKIIFDRHVISFLSVKDRRNVDPYLPDLASPDAYRRVLGRVRVLATIQKRTGVENCPALAEWVSNNLEDVYERFHDANKRESIRKTVDKIKKIGDLTKIALCFEDMKLFQGDLGGFYLAMQEYKRLDDEKNKITDRLKNKKNYGHRSGQQVASVVSMLIAFLIMLIAAYATFVTG